MGKMGGRWPKNPLKKDLLKTAHDWAGQGAGFEETGDGILVKIRLNLKTFFVSLTYLVWDEAK
jgi:hypothetical protein